MGISKNIFVGSIILGVSVALQITNNHVQITYYLAFICLAYGFVEFYNAIVIKKIKIFLQTTFVLVFVAALALGTNAGYFLALNEYGKYSIRGKTELKPIDENKESVRDDGLDRDYVFSYSSSITEPMTFLIADYFGGASTGSLDINSNFAQALKEKGADPQQIREYITNVPLYFGDQPMVAGPFYIGAIVCFLFVFGMIIVSDKLKWAMLACTIFGTLLMYGKNLPTLNYFLFDYFPLYNKFRSVTMAVIIPQFCIAVVVGLCLKTFFESKNKNQYIKPLLIAASATGGLSFLVFILTGTGTYSTPSDTNYLPDWLINALSEDRKSIRSTDAFRSFCFISLAVAIVYSYIREKTSKKYAALGLILITLIDLWGVDKRYLNQNQFEKNAIKNFYTPTEADVYILQDKDFNYRVLNLKDPFNESRTSYFHKSIGGYSPAKLRRYQDLIERKIYVEYNVFIDGLKNKETNFRLTPILNMLNTRYIVAGDEAQSVIKNDSAYGNAWYVKDIKTVNTADEEMAELSLQDPRNTAIINKNRFNIDQVHFLKDTNAYIKLITFKPYELVYECENKNEGFIVFSEIYYPKGWVATIDEKPTEIKQVNYVLRGLHIQQGKHIIKMKMTNESSLLGNKIALGCSGLIYFGFILALYFAFFPTKRK